MGIYAPTLINPANGNYLDPADPFFTFEAGYANTTDDSGNAYAFRVKLSGGSYQYWNAATSSLQGTIVWNPIVIDVGTAMQFQIPGSAFANNSTYEWSYAFQDQFTGAQSAFASDFSFVTQTAPTVVVTAPTGTLNNTPNPTISWTGTFSGGGTQVAYNIIVESGSYGTEPGAGTQLWASYEVSAATSVPMGISLPAGSATYRVFVQLYAAGYLVGPWSYTTFTDIIDGPATPALTATTGTDGNGCPVIVLNVQGYDNYLTAVDSNFETGIGTWAPISGSCALAQSSAQAKDGSHSLSMTAAGTAAMEAGTGQYALPITATGTNYWFSASVRAAATARSCSLVARWYNGSGYMSSSTVATANDNTTGWITMSGNASVPAGATLVMVAVLVNSSVTSEVHYVDCAGFFPNGATAWAVGGFGGVANGEASAVYITRSDGVAVRNASFINPTKLNASQQAQVFDYEAIPLWEYTYAALIVDQAANVYGPFTAQTPEISLPRSLQWWLIDPLNPTGAVPCDLSADTQRAIHEVGQLFYAFGRDTATKTTDGAKGFWDGNWQFRLTSLALQQRLRTMLASGDVLLIQSPVGEQGYVMKDPGTDAQETLNLATAIQMPHFDTTVTFVSADRPPV